MANSSEFLSIIISTYNSEKWLEKVLWGYQTQLDKNFEVVIADDGSAQPTADLIAQMREKVTYSIQHVWQEDHGFQKTKILNKALQACQGKYIVMSDGDCIPRKDFLQAHRDNMAANHFLSGGYFKLNMSVSKVITKADIDNQSCFDIAWLYAKGLPKTSKAKKLTASGFKANLLNKITPTKASWNGHNVSGWKADILEVNGFDERMQYGGEDRELGERLVNIGVKSKQIRYSAICIHLDHDRCYKTQEMVDKNLAIRKKVVSQKITWTKYGIEKREK